MTHAVPKVHPATRAVEPEDPMNLHGIEVDGDPEIMLRLLVEDFARMGWGLEPMMGLARNPFYAALHGLYLRFGEEPLHERITAVLRRVGVLMRIGLRMRWRYHSSRCRLRSRWTATILPGAAAGRWWLDADWETTQRNWRAGVFS